MRGPISPVQHEAVFTGVVQRMTPPVTIEEALVVRLGLRRRRAAREAVYDANQNHAYAPAMAAAVNHVVEGLKVDVPEMPPRFREDVLAVLASARRRIADEMGHDNHADFGRCRTVITETRIEGTQYDGYRRRALRLLGSADAVQRAEDGLRLTWIRRRPLRWEHAAPGVVSPAVERMRQSFERALEPASTKTAMWHHLAELHWWGAHAAPFHRGTAGIMDALSKVVLVMRGVRLRRWRAGVSPDCEALVMRRSLFVRRYRSFLEPLIM